jgi:hypothetical protein
LTGVAAAGACFVARTDGLESAGRSGALFGALALEARVFFGLGSSSDGLGLAARLRLVFFFFFSTGSGTVP